jgi:hypothetical protein
MPCPTSISISISLSIRRPSPLYRRSASVPSVSPRTMSEEHGVSSTELGLFLLFFCWFFGFYFPSLPSWKENLASEESVQRIHGDACRRSVQVDENQKERKGKCGRCHFITITITITVTVIAITVVVIVVVVVVIIVVNSYHLTNLAP